MTREEHAHFVARGCLEDWVPRQDIETWRVLPKGLKAAWVRRLAKNITHRRPEENVNAAQAFYTSSTRLPKFYP
jgi:hypothetical protein